MWQTQFAVYLGEETSDGFFGFIGENNLYLVLETKSGLEKSAGRTVLGEIKQAVVNEKIDNLSKFDNFISQQIQKHNLPTGLSLSAGYIINGIIYLKTIGEGKIFVRRKNKFEKIIENNQTASGFINAGDFFIFTSDRFTQLFTSEIELQTIFDHKSPHQIVEDLAPQIKTNDDQGVIALVAQFVGQLLSNTQEEKEKIIVSQPMIIEKVRNFINHLTQRLVQSRASFNKKRTTTLLVTIGLIAVLIWSVGFGLIRRNDAQLNQQLNRSRQLIEQKLDQAEEVTYLKLSKAQSLINEAREELRNLKKLAGNKKQKELAEIERMIAEKENKIVSKEEKKADEFYDLTIDNKQAQGSIGYLDADNFFILDRKQSNIYKLSLSKKSMVKQTAADIESASLVAGYQDKLLYLVEDKGIFESVEGEKAKVVVKADKDWGKLTDFWVYNGNLYLLDSDKDEIYKYLAGEGGYSNKSGYFQTGESSDLSDSVSIAIDSSVYIGFPEYGLKYTAGSKDVFKTEFPVDNISIEKLYTTKDLEKVFAWDKANSAIYVLGKNGGYERQIQSSIFSQGSDLVVFENDAYVIVKEKIYRVSLD